MNAFRITTALGYVLPYGAFVIAANIISAIQAINDRSFSLAATRQILFSDLAVTLCISLVVGFITWNHWITSKRSKRGILRAVVSAIVVFVLMPLVTLFTATNSFVAGLETQALPTPDPSSWILIWLNGTADLAYSWRSFGALPLSATDDELRAADQRYGEEEERKFFGLPLTATDAEVKGAEKKFAAIKLRKSFGLATTATDLEVQAAEEKIATIERRNSAEETRKIFGLPASASAAQLLAVERNGSQYEIGMKHSAR